LYERKCEHLADFRDNSSKFVRSSSKNLTVFTLYTKNGSNFITKINGTGYFHVVKISPQLSTGIIKLNHHDGMKTTTVAGNEPEMSSFKLTYIKIYFLFASTGIRYRNHIFEHFLIP